MMLVFVYSENFQYSAMGEAGTLGRGLPRGLKTTIGAAATRV